jgi:hypothetical protein
MEEALPVIYEFVCESLSETPYRTIEDLEGAAAGKKPKADRMVVEMTPPGVPCPHCSGNLSEKALKELLMKIFMRYHRGDDMYDC